jgi:hypothetical protein
MKESDVLRQVARVATLVAPGAGTLIALGLEFVADLVDAGQDPRVVLPRLRDHVPGVQAVRMRRLAALRDKFPPPSSPGMNDPGDEDPYAD